METTHTAAVQYSPHEWRPGRTNYLTNGRLVKDARGRVRFTHDGVRFEVGKNGYLTVYERTGRNLESVNYNDSMGGAVPATFLSNPALLRTLANAIELATE